MCMTQAPQKHGHGSVEKQVGSETAFDVFLPRNEGREYDARGVDAHRCRLQFEVINGHLKMANQIF